MHVTSLGPNFHHLEIQIELAQSKPKWLKWFILGLKLSKALQIMSTMLLGPPFKMGNIKLLALYSSNFMQFSSIIGHLKLAIFCRREKKVQNFLKWKNKRTYRQWAKKHCKIMMCMLHEYSERIKHVQINVIKV